jgi:arsenate reductase
MSEITLYHNPRCSKSRQTLALLEDKGIQPTIVLYLKDTPNKATLKKLIKQLQFSSARDLMRKKEVAYREFALDDESLSEDELLDAMIENPILIERPIACDGHRARIGRPPETGLELL